MYKVDLPVDRSADQAVQRRIAAETARKARIYNPRSRVMGLDVRALDQQVWEKQHQQHMERQRDKAFDELMRRHDEAMLQQERDESERRAALQADLTYHWATHQRAEDSTDADLKCNLKGALKFPTPEAELGPASMQIFQGEGIGEEQKRRAQMQKTARDFQIQKEYNEKRRMEDKQKEVLMGKELVHQDLRAVELDALEEECKRAARIALSNYNHALAAEQAEKLKERRMREEGGGLAEMWHLLTSDMLTECPEAAEREVGGAGPHRVLTDRWRGMSAEQLSDIHRKREEQRIERQRQREAERMLDAAWDLQQMKLSREAEEEERRAAEQRRQKRIQLDQDNKQLAREQQAYQEYLNKQLYTNKPTVDYFCQFNTSSR
ncbi:RIB43A-like with coiled-coils protein 1 [Myripristis murdjan]|uniref:RIB43A-like with coiled-coils protein 1 n=1 Tax=Myripristis murdjan TaxID=586833 RepID=A0A667X1Q6_9TELE|nr:RIB43A-like with coiled-coils protein 1 [Myripristis murdjan]